MTTAGKGELPWEKWRKVDARGKGGADENVLAAIDRTLNRCADEAQAWYNECIVPLIEAGQKCRDEAHEVVITHGKPRNIEFAATAEQAWDAALANLPRASGKTKGGSQT
jgi:hypothetical protein